MILKVESTGVGLVSQDSLQQNLALWKYTRVSLMHHGINLRFRDCDICSNTAVPGTPLTADEWEQVPAAIQIEAVHHQADLIRRCSACGAVYVRYPPVDQGCVSKRVQAIYRLRGYLDDRSYHGRGWAGLNP